MNYAEHPAPPDLADLVSCAWTLSGAPVAHAPAGAPDAPQPIVPDGRCEIVLNLGDDFEQLDGGGARVQPRVMVAGQITAPLHVRPTGAVRMIGIRLHSWAGGAVLRAPMHALRDRVVPLADLVGEPAARLTDRLGEHTDDGFGAPAMVRDLWAVVRAWRRGALMPRPLTRAAVRLARGAGDAPSVRAIAGALGASVRTVERAFREEVGLAPKSLLRIARVQRALALSQRYPQLSWTTIAHRAGYFDQPHLVRDFRALVGTAPAASSAGRATLTAAFIDSGNE